MDRVDVIIYKSNTAIEAQAVSLGKTLVGKKYKLKGEQKPSVSAMEFGKDFAKLLNAKKITKISYNRNGSKYHGIVKAFAEGLREAKVEF